MGLTRSEGFPRNFGPYLLLSSLGRGGMGEVFLAKKRAVSDIDRLCIVKTLRGDLAEHQEYVRRFLDEARVVVQLNHSNICQVYDAGKIGGDYTLEMEYIPGVNLKDLAADVLHAGQKIEPGLALYIGEQICESLAYAHKLKSPTSGEHLKVIHRDVSPANVMVSFEGEVKLIDFGLAESTLKTEQTETRLVMGKVAYMAPEQARGDEIDGSIDQFAAAILVYEAMTGDRYYGDMNTHQVWQIVGLGGHVPRMWRGLDADVQKVLGRALNADPKQRFPSCDAFRNALEELRAAKFPRAGRSALRDVMDKLYGDRRDAEADLIASYADLRAPPANAQAELAESATMKNQRPPVGQWENATDPWRNSPSGPSRSALAPQHPGELVMTMSSPSAPALAPPHGLTGASSRPSPRPAEETPLSGAVDVAGSPRPVANAGGVSASHSASAALMPPKNTAARLVAATVGIAVVAVVAVVLWPKGNDARSVDAGTTPVVARIVDAGSAPVIAKIVDAGTIEASKTIDAGTPAVAAIVDAGVAHNDAAVTTSTKHSHTSTTTKHDVKETKTDPKKTDPKENTKVAVDATKDPEHPDLVITKKPDPPPPPPPPKKVALTDAQLRSVIMKCLGKQICAGGDQDFLPMLDSPKKHGYAATVLQKCADDCMDKSGIRP